MEGDVRVDLDVQSVSMRIALRRYSNLILDSNAEYMVFEALYASPSPIFTVWWQPTSFKS